MDLEQNKHESGEYCCYICQEPCDNELSPCECKTPVHQECLNNFRQVQAYEDRKSCTICNKSFISIPIHPHTMPERILRVRRHRERILCYKLKHSLIFNIVAVFVCGYIGKLLLYPYEGAPDDDVEYWSPFNFAQFYYGIALWYVVNILWFIIRNIYIKVTSICIKYDELEEDDYNNYNSDDDSYDSN